MCEYYNFYFFIKGQKSMDQAAKNFLEQQYIKNVISKTSIDRHCTLFFSIFRPYTFDTLFHW